MTFEQTMLLCGGLFAFIFVIAVISSVMEHKKIKKEYGSASKKAMAEEEKRLSDEGEVLEIYAEVIDMICGVHTAGEQLYTNPKATREFLIKFREDNGRIYDIFVDESFYDGFEKGQRGKLILVDGRLYSFETE